MDAKDARLIQSRAFQFNTTHVRTQEQDEHEESDIETSYKLRKCDISINKHFIMKCIKLSI